MPITVYYHTGWAACVLHGCPKGESAWRDFPSENAPEHPGWKRFTVEADGIEFVVCDTQKVDWDKPPDWYGKPNYSIEGGGLFSLNGGHLRKVRKDRVLVVTDLDHTLVGHERDPENKLVEEFRNLWLGEFSLNGSNLVYSTGRNRKDALSVACERGLPRPELLVCGVGTEVYKVPRTLPIMGWWEAGEDQLTLVPEWKATMELFKRGEAEARLVTEFQRFEVRGNSENDPYRIPCAYEMDSLENFEHQKQVLASALGPEYQVISSGEGAWKLVDVCSAQAGKLKAMEFAMRTLKFEPAMTLACGDSGNDELMYRCKGAHAVMVRNALSELVRALTAAARPERGELQPGVFETCHGSTVLFSNREVAGGICEALQQFWPAA
jgi:sucrose-6F-phosphate phosphohydrolase